MNIDGKWIMSYDDTNGALYIMHIHGLTFYLIRGLSLTWLVHQATVEVVTEGMTEFYAKDLEEAQEIANKHVDEIVNFKYAGHDTTIYMNLITPKLIY